tara:strand:- start:2850 stop:3179 length:330 start_codon:yes stop_codon:yes gene_type:complete
MKVTKANCGASVKAANGGYMKVKKTGYNDGGTASKKKSDMDDRSKYSKRADGVAASKGGMASKKKVKSKAKGYNEGGTPRVAVNVCNACSTPKKCTSNGRCAKSGKKLV